MGLEKAGILSLSQPNYQYIPFCQNREHWSWERPGFVHSTGYDRRVSYAFFNMRTTATTATAPMMATMMLGSKAPVE